MANCNLTKVPMVEGIKLEANMNYQKVDYIMYKKMVGKPIYLVIIKLHINFSISIMSPFLTNPATIASKCKKTNIYVLKGYYELVLSIKRGIM